MSPKPAGHHVVRGRPKKERKWLRSRKWYMSMLSEIVCYFPSWRARKLATPVCIYIIDTHTILMLMRAAGFQWGKAPHVIGTGATRPRWQDTPTCQVPRMMALLPDMATVLDLFFDLQGCNHHQVTLHAKQNQNQYSKRHRCWQQQ